MSESGVMCRTLVWPNISQEDFPTGLVWISRGAITIYNTTNRLAPKVGENQKVMAETPTECYIEYPRLTANLSYRGEGR